MNQRLEVVTKDVENRLPSARDSPARVPLFYRQSVEELKVTF